MKKIVLALALASFILMAARPVAKTDFNDTRATMVADSFCTNLVKVVDAASKKQLASIKGTAKKTEYYNSKLIFAPLVELPGTLDNFIVEDDYSHRLTYHCTYKVFNSDKTAAMESFRLLMKLLADCLTGAEVTNPSEGTGWIIYKNAKIGVNTYRYGNTDKWITRFSIANTIID